MRTKLLSEIGNSQEICTDFAQNSPRLADKRVRFPVTIKYRGIEAKIYRPVGKFRYYRIASYQLNLKFRMMVLSF